MNTITRSLVFLLLSIAGSAQASRPVGYVFLTISATKTAYWAESRTDIAKIDEMRTFWIYEDASSDKTRKYREAKSLIKVDCKSKKIGTLHHVSYKPSGDIFDSFSNDYPEMSYVVPDTIGRTLLDHACNEVTEVPG